MYWGSSIIPEFGLNIGNLMRTLLSHSFHQLMLWETSSCNPLGATRLITDNGQSVFPELGTLGQTSVENFQSSHIRGEPIFD